MIHFPDSLTEIISLVKNSLEPVSFKIITKEFSISKITTRKRVKQLQSMGLIFLKKNGRKKILHLTKNYKKLKVEDK